MYKTDFHLMLCQPFMPELPCLETRESTA